MTPYLEVPFTIISVVQRRKQLVIETWYLPAKQQACPITEHPLRLLYRTTDLGNARQIADWIGFGYILVRTGEREIRIHAIRDKVEVQTHLDLVLSGEPELLGLIRTGA